MSVITFPRRVVARPSHQPEPPAGRTAALHAPSVAHRSRLSLTKKVGIVFAAALLVVMIGNSYAAERQVQLHALQTQLLQDQAKYATQVAKLTNTAAPARVATQAGKLHLVVPASVTQITAVPLNVKLPVVKLRGTYSVHPRDFS